ncbi:MAG: dicarboxylate/amino acid:cation symporter, partial [Bacteroidota bacterium]
SGKDIVADWINPFGTIFVRLLKLIAIPLILASLIKGISDLKDISKFSNIGLRTIITYIITTVFAITIGLALVNIAEPGSGISEETVAKLTETYANDSGVQTKIVEANKDRGPLQFLVDMVPDNAFSAFSNNKLMLQVIFFTILFGISMLLIGEKAAEPLKKFFDGLNDVVLKMVDLIMLFAPYAVFALLAQVVVTAGDPEILTKLLAYAGVVVLGLILMIVFYLLIVSFIVKKNPFWFLKEISPAQLLAFSTSSSAATLPVTMERVEEHIGVDKEVSSFVLPVGATINMDGTSLYQAVAAVFIMQVLWPEGLTMSNQLTIIVTALLASIGSAAVPGAGMVMLVIVLEAVGFPADKLPIALALIFAVDRPLDMCRTVVNVTGDATVSMLVAKAVGKLGKPRIKDWDDHYEEVK